MVRNCPLRQHVEDRTRSSTCRWMGTGEIVARRKAPPIHVKGLIICSKLMPASRGCDHCGVTESRVNQIPRRPCSPVAGRRRADGWRTVGPGLNRLRLITISETCHRERPFPLVAENRHAYRWSNPAGFCSVEFQEWTKDGIPSKHHLCRCRTIKRLARSRVSECRSLDRLLRFG